MVCHCGGFSLAFGCLSKEPGLQMVGFLPSLQNISKLQNRGFQIILRQNHMNWSFVLTPKLGGSLLWVACLQGRSHISGQGWPPTIWDSRSHQNSQPFQITCFCFKDKSQRQSSMLSQFSKARRGLVGFWGSTKVWMLCVEMLNFSTLCFRCKKAVRWQKGVSQ